MSARVPRPWERSEFSTPHEAQQVDNELLRAADAYDIYGDREQFIVRVLTRPIPIAAEDFKAVMQASGDNATLLEGDSAARIVFAGRIESDSAPSPHSTIPDPCDPSIGTNPGCAAKIVSWHTKFFSRSDYEGRVPEIGDLVKVNISPGTFKYNLQYAFFDSLDAVTNEVPDNKDCSRLDALFKGFNYNDLGTILPPADVNPDPNTRTRGVGGSDAKCSGETPVSQIDWNSISAKPMKTGPSPTQGCLMCAGVIPDGKGTNWRSPQPSLGNLKWFAETNGIKRILRYNGRSELKYDKDVKTTSGTSGVCIGVEVEKAYARRLGMEFERASAHKGGSPGHGYKRSTEHSQNWLEKGNTLVHCTHGADRTGMIVGAWLKHKNKMRGCMTFWRYATSYNSWNLAICRNGNLGYAAYLDALCPFTEFCNGDMYNSCKGCKKVGINAGAMGVPLLPRGWTPSGVNPPEPPSPLVKCAHAPEGSIYYEADDQGNAAGCYRYEEETDTWYGPY